MPKADKTLKSEPILESGSRDREIEVLRLQSPVSYAAGLQLQVARRDAVERGGETNALFLLEHTSVITLGRKSHADHILYPPEELQRLGVALCETDRGGDVTYHGPGQLVAYPVLRLESWKATIRGYMRALEEVLIRTLARFSLDGERIQGLTGVWVGDAKVAAIGIGVHNWVTYHGIALNVDPNMEHFRLIVPCGLADRPVTSLRILLDEPPTMTQVMDAFEQEFLRYFAEYDGSRSQG